MTLVTRDVETYRFEVAWLGPYESVRVGTSITRQRTLDDAIAWAAAGVVAHPRAHGFHVERIGVVPAERSS